MKPQRRSIFRLLWASAFAGVTLFAAAAQAQTDLAVGLLPIASSAPFYLAKEKGYFAAEGLNVEIQPISTFGEVAPLLVSGRMHFVAGGMGAPFFTALHQGMPVKIVLSHASSPGYHNLMLRSDLKDQVKTIADLKGRTMAMLGRGSTAFYEGGKILETAGLTLKDVEIKYMPVTQTPTAFAGKVIDVGLAIPPQPDLIAASGVAIKWIDNADSLIEPAPMEITAVVVNTDWAAKNAKAAHGFIFALSRGVRDYCTAYHGGPNRPEVVAAITRHTAMKDAAMVDKMVWPSRHVTTPFNEASIMDQQEWFGREGFLEKKLPIGDMVDQRYFRAATERLGPFAVPAGSTLKGCR
jgi:NitT/TauT family transport system substrate-binding protein